MQTYKYFLSAYWPHTIKVCTVVIITECYKRILDLSLFFVFIEVFISSKNDCVLITYKLQKRLFQLFHKAGWNHHVDEVGTHQHDLNTLSTLVAQKLEMFLVSVLDDIFITDGFVSSIAIKLDRIKNNKQNVLLLSHIILYYVYGCTVNRFLVR